MSSVDDVKTLLKDHSDDVTIAYHAESGSTTVTATGYLPKAKWQTINQLVKDNGGTYIPKTDGGPKWVFGEMTTKGTVSQTKDLTRFRKRLEDVVQDMKEAGY